MTPDTAAILNFLNSQIYKKKQENNVIHQVPVAARLDANSLNSTAILRLLYFTYNTWFLRLTRVHTLNGIWISSAIKHISWLCQTDRHTDHVTSVAIGRISALGAYAMRPDNICIQRRSEEPFILSFAHAAKWSANHRFLAEIKTMQHK